MTRVISFLKKRNVGRCERLICDFHHVFHQQIECVNTARIMQQRVKKMAFASRVRQHHHHPHQQSSGLKNEVKVKFSSGKRYSLFRRARGGLIEIHWLDFIKMNR